MKVLMVGGGKTLYFLCRNFAAKGYEVVLVNRDQGECVQMARQLSATVVCGDGSDPAILKEAGAMGADVVLAITPNDQDNLVISQLASLQFGVPRAVALANDSHYGLTASVWTRSRKRADWFADRLEAGPVTVNDHMYSFVDPRAIWGGIKQTGMGRCHGPFGLHELVNIKYISHDYLGKKAQPWWYPYDRGLTTMFEKAIPLFHGPSLGVKLRAAWGLLPNWGRVRSTGSLLNYVKGLPRILKK